MNSFDATIIILCTLVELSLSHPEEKIVGGHSINITEAPYQVSFNIRETHFCGGALISASFVLSAAHCFSVYPATSFKIRAGSTHRTEGGVVIGVMEAFVHPYYDDLKFDFDIAIAKLASTLELSENIQPIQIPPSGEQFKEGEMTFVSGWGDTKTTTEDPQHLRAVEVPIVSKEVCEKAYREMLTENMICAGYAKGGKDSCSGDSGGPMVRISDKLLIGIVSWGRGCALPYYPGVYVRVSSFRQWILSVTGI